MSPRSKEIGSQIRRDRYSGRGASGVSTSALNLFPHGLQAVPGNVGFGQRRPVVSQVQVDELVGSAAVPLLGRVHCASFGEASEYLGDAGLGDTDEGGELHLAHRGARGD